MASIFPDIRKILEVQLATAAGSTEVAWENLKFSPTTGVPYLKPTTILTIRRPTCAGTDPEQYYQGLLIIECNSPDNSGPSDSDELVKTLIDSFEATNTYTDGTHTVQIRTAEHGQGVTDGPWHKTIIQISWFSYY